MTYRTAQKSVNGFRWLGSLLPSGTALAARCTVMPTQRPPSTVLVIGSGDVIETVRGVIDGVGLTSVHAASAAAALERIPDVSPRTIVVDDRVDDMPLRALIRQVQAVHEGVGTVVLTDASQPRAAELPGCELMERSSARERVDAYLRRLVETGQPVARPSRPLSPERRRFFRTYGSLFRR